MCAALLDRRARHASIRTEHAAVARLGAERVPAGAAGNGRSSKRPSASFPAIAWPEPAGKAAFQLYIGHAHLQEGEGEAVGCTASSGFSEQCRQHERERRAQRRAGRRDGPQDQTGPTQADACGSRGGIGRTRQARARHSRTRQHQQREGHAKHRALCSDSQTSCGTAVTSPASAAPAPSATITAGSTQHTRVPRWRAGSARTTPRLRRSGALASMASVIGASPACGCASSECVGATDGDHRVAGVGHRLAQRWHRRYRCRP